ncbi:unnamed protein product [Clonostachys solani]|uniref:Jacalin-type lectin domain-containing protein n=1 Tax=Clonostachys solani TaxID=160281 RepID=A0A9N9Z846_9HYPO|nr:unnamed protein product [Clonostachys solani]
MAPNFLKSLRRRSRASFRTDRSTDTSSEGATSNGGTGPPSGSATPPSIAYQSDPALHLQVKDASDSKSSLGLSQQQYAQPQARPPLTPAAMANRHSVSGMSGLGSPSTHGRLNAPISQYAPRIHNVPENAWVYQKALLVHGSIGDTELHNHSLDGSLTITRLDDNIPATSWPVCESRFKAMIYLQPGPNKLRFDFSSPKLANSTTSNPIHASYLTVHMMPNTSAPPLQLAIVLGKDSPGVFDAPPARAEREGNGLDTAVRKLRMAAYLWQAFTAEQMYRHKMGRRAFRFEEEWTSGTANHRDREYGTMRSEARVHIIRSEQTVAELRDIDGTNDKEGLLSIVADAVKQYFDPLPGQKQYVSALLLDSHWDPASKTVTGHAALGGAVGDLNLAVFGSHCLYSYPASIEEVVPAFTDCTPTDSNYVSNCSDSGSSWEAANIGIGGHLHETGHLFGCPHQEGGVMLRDYVVFNRSFVSREAYSTRTKTKGGFCWTDTECEWHRLDCLRFRAHAAFRLPNDIPMNFDEGVQVFPADGGQLLATAATGISFVEIYCEGDDVCGTWIECPADAGHIQKQISLTEQDLRKRLPEAKRKADLKIAIKSHGGQSVDVDDFVAFVSKKSSVKLENGTLAFRSKPMGQTETTDDQFQDIAFISATRQDRVLSRIVVYHGEAVHGLQFVYDDESSQLLGMESEGENGDVFDLDVRRGEYISGFYVRAGLWIDALQILTSLGRKSLVFGKPFGGDGHLLIPPRGYTICGVSGSCGARLDSFSILIQR